MRAISTPKPRTETLSSGLQVCLAQRRQVPVVATALCYRAGSLDEPVGREGVAHFLEHMMFRGSTRFGPGQLDRLTQALGGSNNAYTSHDSTAYFFSFARDRWTTALEMEADRMSGLLLDPALVEAERAVILEELNMHQDDPWDALEDEVMAALYGQHPYGRPVLGLRQALMALGPSQLGDFHAAHYRPQNAVLAIVGDVGPEAFDEAERIFAGGLPAGKERSARGDGIEGNGSQRVERRSGTVCRLLCAVRGPGLGEQDYPAWRLLAAMMGAGRASRLHRSLVEERRLCAFVSVDVTETTASGALLIAAEAIPGGEPDEVERLLNEELERACHHGFTEQELIRAKSVLAADWVLGHEQAQEIALTFATAGALLDVDFPARHLEELQDCSLTQIERVAERYLRPDSHRVVGWSLAEGSED